MGDSYQGGIVAYILVDGDPGYDANQQHGLIVAAAAEQSEGICWHSSNSGVTDATETALGTGNANTTNIINLYGTESNAARLCYDYTNSDTGTGVYSDWFLPSKVELNKLYINKVAIGGFDDNYYWSSSENSAIDAWFQGFYDGLQRYVAKSHVGNNTEDNPWTRAVPVRAF